MSSFFDQSYYKWNKKTLSWIGAWPEQSPFKRRLIPSLICFSLWTILIPEIIRVMDLWPDVDALLEWLPPLLVISITKTQLLNSYANHKRFQIMLDRIRSDWKRFDGTPNVQILHKYAYQGSWITVHYTVSMYIVCLIYCSFPVTIPIVIEYFIPSNETVEKVYLFDAEYGVNSDDYYTLIFIHMTVLTYATCIVMISNDSMYFVYVEHACALFEIVRLNLERLSNSPVDLSDGGTDLSYKIISSCVHLHRDAIFFASLIESCYTACFAGVILFCLLLLSVTGLQVLMYVNEPGNFIRFSVFEVAQIVHLYFNSVPGQKIIDYSESISNYAYSVNWYNLSPKAQKMLILIMKRSMTPCQLTAGKIYVMSMENYSAVLQKSMSFFTVLSSTR
ncbi:odorant receptor 9a-like [Venturia canescens]|uniref:odorant receptor 9a-like n=1 Tax=Venturia canescens TaxID=32260 RepID=UPI001C9C6E8B|nr:odorant receptor 9a-like [Venturia canescens]